MTHHHHDPHDHDHHHHHHGESDREMPTKEKLAKLFDHWIRHNDSHAGTYRQWEETARAEGMTDVAAILAEIGTMTDAITQKLQAGAKALGS
ncbi:MAG: hypothetical protein SWH61_02140 [Thermodesulfobacteriota bacterium]|nr:hypothetical protein [Thermodesulfobacteriota bacterium]